MRLRKWIKNIERNLEEQFRIKNYELRIRNRKPEAGDGSPAFAPGIAHHEPGGLMTRELITIIQF